MSINVERITVTGDGIALDLLLWRRFQRHRAGLVERVLDANPRIADLGPILPVGTVVTVPIDAPELSPPKRPAVRLWG